MKRRKIGSIDVLEIPGTPDGPVVVLFHGYGSSAYDLLSLHREIESRPGTSWYFPNGFVKIPLGLGMSGRAWFPIDMPALKNALQERGHGGLAFIIPTGLAEAQTRASEMLSLLAQEKNISSEKIIIGGFSQGAMLATHTFLHSQENFAKLLLLSGTLLAKEDWSRLVLKKPNLTFFQSHGKNDPVLPYTLAEELYTILCSGGSSGSFVSFAGGHEIPPVVLQGMQEFLLS